MCIRDRVVAGGSYFNGAFGRLYVESPAAAGGFDGIVPVMLGGQLSDFLMGTVVVLVLSASMSTLSSLVITSSSTFTLDFIKDRFAPRMSEKKQVLWIRLLCAGFILLSVVLALNPSSTVSYTHLDVYKRQARGRFEAPARDYAGGHEPAGGLCQGDGLPHGH